MKQRYLIAGKILYDECSLMSDEEWQSLLNATNTKYEIL